MILEVTQGLHPDIPGLMGERFTCSGHHDAEDQRWRGAPGVVGVPLLGGQVSPKSWVTNLQEISTESEGKSQVRS